jgi:hypothetical protein
LISACARPGISRATPKAILAIVAFIVCVTEALL